MNIEEKAYNLDHNKLLEKFLNNLSINHFYIEEMDIFHLKIDVGKDTPYTLSAALYYLNNNLNLYVPNLYVIDVEDAEEYYKKILELNYSISTGSFGVKKNDTGEMEVGYNNSIFINDSNNLNEELLSYYISRMLSSCLKLRRNLINLKR